MGVFDEEIKLFDNLSNEIDKTIMETVRKHQFEIKSYNISQLQDAGEDSKGKKLGKYKSRGYKRKRIKRGLQVAYVDTRFSGEFHAQIEVIAEPNQFKISSTIDYGEYVIKRYGKAILGIQQKYLEDFVQKYLFKELKKTINGKLAKS